MHKGYSHGVLKLYSTGCKCTRLYRPIIHGMQPLWRIIKKCTMGYHIIPLSYTHYKISNSVKFSFFRVRAQTTVFL